MSLPQAIDALLACVPDGSLILYASERRNRFDVLDRAAWVEACKIGYENKLPPKSDSGDLGALGLTNLPGLIHVGGDFSPIGVQGWTNRLLALRQLAATGGTPGADSTPEAKSVVASNASIDARALAVFIDHPDWTKKRIAKHLPCNEKSLCPERCPKLAAAIKAHRAPDPSRKFRRGSKDADGNLEAWEEK